MSPSERSGCVHEEVRPRAQLAALLLLVVSACSSGAGSTTSEGNDSAPAPQMEHIHGIGVDPENGAIYAGTHYGLFRIEDGTATRVADRVQDFMGFTVAGPDHFLASGHPGEGQGGHSSVGLIESTDGGQTWQELSWAARRTSTPWSTATAVSTG